MVRLKQGPDAGRTASVGIPPGVLRSGPAAGDAVQILRYPPLDGAAAGYALGDFTRETPLGLLTLVLVASVVLVARLKGLMALLGLGLGLATIGFFALPALQRGQDATLVVAVAAHRSAPSPAPGPGPGP